MGDRPSTHPVDIAIVGAGPTGLFATLYAGLRQMSIKLIDSLEMLGGQLTARYPEKLIYDVPGFPSVLAKELAARLTEQAVQYSPAVCLGEQIRQVEWDEARSVFHLRGSRNAHFARTVLIAAGMGAFQPKTLPLQNPTEFEGAALYYSINEINTFVGKRILIVGGGDSAVNWANMLVSVASHVTLIHRHDRFRAHEDSVFRMRQTPTDIKTFFELKALEGTQSIESAVIYDNRSGEEERLPVDAVLVNVGFVNSLGPMKDWGLCLDGNAIKVDSMMQTSRTGIFAAGDICTFPGKLKLIATGFAEAAIAVNHAKHFLDPSARVFPGHSSNLTGDRLRKE